MKTLLIMLLLLGGSGILMIAGVLLYCAWEFYEGIERTQHTDVETFSQDD